jgi:hypothetical protein
MPKKENLFEINREDLINPGVYTEIGKQVAYLLTRHRVVTLFVHNDDSICFANPLHIYLDANEDGVYLDSQHALTPPPEPYRLTRPVIAEGRPQWVVWRRGQLWEVEPINKEDEDGSGINQT